MIKWICRKLVWDSLFSRFFRSIAERIVWKTLADISVETLREIVNKADQNQKEIGHTDYTSLAELYCSIMSERPRIYGTPKKGIFSNII